MPSTTQLIATADITINGTRLPRFNSVYLNQPFESHHTFEINVSPDMLPDRPAIIHLNELANRYVGEPITINFKQGESQAGVVSSQQEQKFKGIVTSVRMSKTQSSTSAIIISGSSPTILLCSGPDTRSFSDKRLKDIVTELTAEVGISSRVDPTENFQYKYTVQYQEETFTYLQRKADTWGEWMYYDGETFVFGIRARSLSAPITLNLGINLFDMDYTLRVTPLNNNWLADNYHENKQHQTQSSAPVNGLQTYAMLVAEKSEKLYKDAPTQIAPGLHTSSSLNDIAVRSKAKRATELAVLHGRTPEMELQVGSTIKVKESIYTATDPRQGAVKNDTIDYGQFVITRLTHYIDATGVYQATFEAIPQDGNHPPVAYNLPPYQPTPEIAKVVNVNDPQGMGRVKVQFFFQEPDNLSTDWITVPHAISGNERGFYFTPEVGEHVMVDFLWGIPSNPFVLSSMYDFDAMPGNLLFNPDNNIKGIITRSGNHIIIDDESGKESIKIYNKSKKNSIELSLDGTHITLKSEGDINLQAAGDITMKAKNISMKAEKDWKTTADHAVISSDTGDVELSSGKELIMSAMTNATLGATAELKAFGKMTKITADAQLEIDGGAVTTMKGGLVKIN